MLSLSNLWQVQGSRKLWLGDGPLENLWRGGGGRSTKKNSRKGKLNEKILARQLTLKNIHAMALKKFIQGI